MKRALLRSRLLEPGPGLRLLLDDDGAGREQCPDPERRLSQARGLELGQRAIDSGPGLGTTDDQRIEELIQVPLFLLRAAQSFLEHTCAREGVVLTLIRPLPRGKSLADGLDRHR